MKRVNYIEETGKILGFYDDEIHKSIPKINITITEDEWKKAINMKANHIEVNTKTFSLKDFRTPDELEIDELENIKNKTQVQIETLTKDYPSFEKDTFWIQELEAKEYKKDLNADTQFIDALCESRGIEKGVMVDKILSNAAALKVATAKIVGSYQANLK